MIADGIHTGDAAKLGFKRFPSVQQTTDRSLPQRGPAAPVTVLTHPPEMLPWIMGILPVRCKKRLLKYSLPFQRFEKRVDAFFLDCAFSEQHGNFFWIEIHGLPFAGPRAGQCKESPPIACLGHQARCLFQRNR